MLLEQSHLDKVLYFVDRKPPNHEHLKFIEEIHAGSFDGHFTLKGMYGTLSTSTGMEWTLMPRLFAEEVA